MNTPENHNSKNHSSPAKYSDLGGKLIGDFKVLHGFGVLHLGFAHHADVYVRHCCQPVVLGQLDSAQEEFFRLLVSPPLIVFHACVDRCRRLQVAGALEERGAGLLLAEILKVSTSRFLLCTMQGLLRICASFTPYMDCRPCHTAPYGLGVMGMAFPYCLALYSADRSMFAAMVGGAAAPAAPLAFVLAFFPLPATTAQRPSTSSARSAARNACRRHARAIAASRPMREHSVRRFRSTLTELMSS